MPIKTLSITNFKGISARQEFEFRPITLFVGANSSGKSSAIHGMVTLAQTLKLGNSTPSVVLDDEFAHVHLGRFVEIVHSHSYKDALALGVNVGHAKIFEFNGDVHAEYSFKSTLRTQEVYVEGARLALNDATAFSVKRGTKAPYAFSVVDERNKRRMAAVRTGNFFFKMSPTGAELTDAAQMKEWYGSSLMFDSIQRTVEEAMREVRYLGPFRQPPLRRYPFRGAIASEVGSQGEATITLLASEAVQAQGRTRSKQVSKWLEHLGLAKSVELSRVGTSDLFDVTMRLTDDTRLPIADLGYGLSQVLPVLTQCSFAPEGATLLFEQPELHLHENAAKRLAHVFTETAGRGVTSVIETHSKELIYELFTLIKQGTYNVDDLAIYTVKREDGASKYRRLGMELEGGSLEVDDPWFKTLTGE